MLLKELVLNSLETFESFIVDGKILNKKLYENLADTEIKNFYLDKENNKLYLIVTLEI